MIPRAAGGVVLCAAGLIAACSPVPTDPASHDAGETPAARPTGPRLRVAPATGLAFGQVPFFADAAAATIRKMVLFNDGDAPLVIRDAALDPGSSELALGGPGSGPGEVQLQPRAGENLLELELRLRPEGLGKRSWQLRFRTNDPARPEVVIPISAEVVTPPPCHVTVDPDRVYLDRVAPPETREVTVRIHNAGAAPVEQCLVRDLRLVGADARFVSLPGGGISQRILQAGETLEVPVRVTSRDDVPATTTSAALELELSATTRPHVSVPITANLSPESCLVIGPDALDFGQTCPRSRRHLTVYNACAGSVVLSSIAASKPSEFWLVGTPPMTKAGLELAPGTHAVFEVAYQPEDAGPDSGELRITAGVEPNTFDSVAALTGVAAELRSQTDVFTVESLPKRDLLLVIDNSPSMAPYQAGLATNLARYLRYLEAARTDFHLAVITTDPAAGTEFLTGPTHPDAVLTPTSPDLEMQLTAKVEVGTNGSGSSRCLAQALAALTTEPANQAAGFLRQDASLDVVCITDTTDDSPLPVKTYLGGLWAIHGQSNKTMFSLSAIAGMSWSCPGDTGRLASAVWQTSGLSGDICASDWSKTLEMMSGFSFFGYRHSFPLTSIPDLSRGSIEVKVGDVLIDPIEPNGQEVWTYDPVSNAVSFEPLFVPDSGEAVTITYPIFCTW